MKRIRGGIDEDRGRLKRELEEARGRDVDYCY